MLKYPLIAWFFGASTPVVIRMAIAIIGFWLLLKILQFAYMAICGIIANLPDGVKKWGKILIVIAIIIYIIKRLQ